MARSAPGASRSRGWIWAAAMLFTAAGAVGWFGPAINGEAPRSSGSTVTLAASGPSITEPVAVVSSLQTGGLPTRVVVPAAGVDAPIAEVGVVVDNGRATWETAWQAVGHHLDSALPGQPGNVVLTGHVSVADRRNLAAFAHLENVRAGDVIDVYSGDEVYHYRVERVAVVAPEAVQVLRSEQSSTVTLITCTHDLKNRLVVTGILA